MVNFIGYFFSHLGVCTNKTVKHLNVASLQMLVTGAIEQKPDLNCIIKKKTLQKHKSGVPEHPMTASFQGFFFLLSFSALGRPLNFITPLLLK